jgi:hypothetical protein
MKASSESGECASLISVTLLVAGFVGIGFRDHSLWSISPEQRARRVTPARAMAGHMESQGTALHPRHREGRLNWIPRLKNAVLLRAEG